jgi:hypothetical protein
MSLSQSLSLVTYLAQLRVSNSPGPLSYFVRYMLWSADSYSTECLRVLRFARSSLLRALRRTLRRERMTRLSVSPRLERCPPSVLGLVWNLSSLSFAHVVVFFFVTALFRHWQPTVLMGRAFSHSTCSQGSLSMAHYKGCLLARSMIHRYITMARSRRCRRFRHTPSDLRRHRSRTTFGGVSPPCYS